MRRKEVSKNGEVQEFPGVSILIKRFNWNNSKGG